MSQVFSTRIKNVLPCLISSNQMAYVRFINENRRVILDREKAFDSVNYCFLLQILQKFRSDIDFVSWIKIIFGKNNP